MQNIKSKAILLSAVAMTVGLASCYEKFDPESYAPSVSIGGFTAASEIASSNLIAYWPFDGNYTDEISKKTGTGTNTSFANGIKGQALKGALKGYVLADPSDALLNAKSFTVAFWVNNKSTTASGGIVGLVTLSNTASFWGNIETFFENGGTTTDGIFKAHIQGDSTDTWVAKEGIVNLYNSWNHIALTYDATTSTFALYVNGSKATSSAVPKLGGLKWKNPGKLVFGANQFQTDPSLTKEASSQDWANYLTGSLDEVRIYNTALKDTELDALVKLESRGK